MTSSDWKANPVFIAMLDCGCAYILESGEWTSLCPRHWDLPVQLVLKLQPGEV